MTMCMSGQCISGELDLCQSEHITMRAKSWLDKDPFATNIAIKRVVSTSESSMRLGKARCFVVSCTSHMCFVCNVKTITIFAMHISCSS